MMIGHFLLVLLDLAIQFVGQAVDRRVHVALGVVGSGEELMIALETERILAQSR